MQQNRIVLFIVLAAVLLGGSFALRPWLFPEKPAKPADPTARESLALALGLHPTTGSWDTGTGKAPPKPEPAKPVDFGFWDINTMRRWAFAKPPEPKPGVRITLGDASPDSNFDLRVILDSRGAAVRSVVLNKFKATDEETGKPTDKVLELIPDQGVLDPENPQKAIHSLATNNVLYHFAGKDASQDNPKARPLATLGQIDWKPSGTEPEKVTINGHSAERISFSTV